MRAGETGRGPKSMEFMRDITTWLLVFAALLAGVVDVIAGGGGPITLPVLLLSGMAPLMALGTNKLQGAFRFIFCNHCLYARGSG